MPNSSSTNTTKPTPTNTTTGHQKAAHRCSLPRCRNGFCDLPLPAPPIHTAAHNLGIDTTGLRYFAECHRHSAKAEKHSANCWPSVALGKAHTAFLLPAKPALPSAFSRALGKPLPCAKSHSAKKVETGRTDGQVNWRTGRRTGERDGGRTGRVENFAECHMLGTRQRFKLRRVPTWPHSAKFGFLPSVRRLALGEV